MKSLIKEKMLVFKITFKFNKFDFEILHKQ